MAKLQNAYGKDLASVISDIKKVNVLSMFDEQSIRDNVKNGYDLIINTHGDIDTYYNKSFSKNNSIAYCHFSSAKFLIQSEDKEYLEKYLKVARDSPSFSIPTDSNAIKEDNNNQSNAVDFDRKRYLEWLKYAYDNMIKNSTVLTNSESMSAGLIPVVPDIGGQTEFVPSKFQYHTLEQAVKIIVSALDIPYSERALISNSVNKFSTPKL